MGKALRRRLIRARGIAGRNRASVRRPWLAALLLICLVASPVAGWPQEVPRNFWDLRDDVHTEQHAQGTASPQPGAAPPPDAAAQPDAPAAGTPASPPDTAAPEEAPPVPAGSTSTGADSGTARPSAAGTAAPPGSSADTGRTVPGAAPQEPAAGTTPDAGRRSPAVQTPAQPAEPEPPRSVDALYRAGRRAERRGRIATAVQAYEAVLRRAPYHFLTHMALGRINLPIDPSTARNHLETARRTHPSTADVHYLLAQAYEGLGRDLDAAEAYRRAIHLNPRHYDANARLRKVLRRLRGGRTVVERAAEAFAADPSLASLTLFGRLILEQLSPRQAVLEFEAVRQQQPELPEVGLWLARAHRAAQNGAAELAAYRRYLQARPQAIGVRLLVVERLASQGWYQQAAALLNQAAQAPAATQSRTVGARVTYLRSRLRSAQQAPGEAGELLLLAHERGYARDAVEQAYAEDLALFPEAPALWFAYGNWLRKVGRSAEGTDALVRAGLLDARHRRKAQASLRLMQKQGTATVSAALALGELALADGDGDAALRYLEQVPPGHPRDGRASLLRGKLFRERGQVDAALDAFTRYVFFHEERRDMLYARGNLFWELGRREEALKLWMEHREVLTRYPHVLLRVAAHYRSQGDTAAEITAREQLVAALPGNQENRIRLGKLYHARGRVLEAVLLWEQVLQERPRDPALLRQVAQGWLALDDADRALPLLQRAAEMGGLDPEASAMLANRLYERREYEAALRAYWALYERQPEHPALPRVLPELVLNLPAQPAQQRAAARLARDAGRLEPAAQLMEAVVNAMPRDPDARIALAEIYLAQDRAQAAETLLAGDGAGGQTQALRLLAKAQARSGQRALLAQTLARLHALEPQDATLPRRRGLLLVDLGRKEAARPLLEQALAAQPEDDAVAVALAEVELALKAPASAERHLRDVLARTPGHEHASRRLVEALIAQRKWEAAAARMEDWLAGHPRDAAMRYNLVAAYLKLFRKEAARPHYEALQETNPRRARKLDAYFR